MFLYPLPLLFVYACAPSLTNRPYTVFTYLTLFPAFVIYTRFGNLPFFRWMFCGVYRVFSAGTRWSTGGLFSPLYGFCQCIHSLNACVYVDTLLCNPLHGFCQCIHSRGGCFPPFTVSVNVYIRLTHVFLSIHYYAIYCISIHASS